MLDKIWEYCKDVHRDSTYWWHDHGFEKEERDEMGIEIEKYDSPDVQIRGDDEEVLTDDEFSDLEEENLREGNEIIEIFRIEMDIFLFETPLCKEFKEFNHLLQIDVNVLT
ncbi:hypothetical protein Tco_1141698 [Tanacetum coccineum]